MAKKKTSKKSNKSTNNKSSSNNAKCPVNIVFDNTMKDSSGNYFLPIQPGTEKTYYAKWKLGGKSDLFKRVDKFRVRFEYQASNGVWFEGSSSELDYVGATNDGFMSTTYSPPENATNIRFRMTFTSKEHTVTKKVKTKKGKKKNKKKTEKYINNISWTSFLYPAGKSVKESIHTFKVEKVEVGYILGDEYPLIAKVTAKNLKTVTYVENYTCAWRFWNGRFWTDGESSTQDPVYESGKDYMLFEYEGDTEIPDDTKRYECTVTPNSNDPYYVGQPVTGSIENIDRRRKIDRIRTGNRSGAKAYASWGLSDMSNVESFDYEWEYYDSSYSYSGGSDGRWVADKSGSVSASQPSGSGDYPYSIDYDIPNVKNVTDFRFRVKPVSDSSSTYIDEWSDWRVINYVRGSVSMKGITVTLNENTDRSLLVKWAKPNPYRDDIASFEYRIYYRISTTGPYVMDTQGSVDVVEGVPDPTAFYNFSYDAKANAKDVYIQMRAVPEEDGGFDAPWSAPVSYTFTIPKRKVTNPRVARHSVSSRQIDAVWTMPDASRVANYEYKWEYYYKNPTLGDIWTEQTGTTTALNCNYTVPDDATIVRFSVRPVPDADTAFIGEWSEYVNFTLNIPKISVGNVSIRKMTDTDRDFIVSWTAPIISDELRTHLASYEIQHRYFADGVWFPSETITISDPDALNSSPITVNERAEVWQARVRPVDDSSGNAFAGDWTNYVDYNIELYIRKCSDISFKLQRGSESTIIATWGIDDNTEVDSYEWEWRYFIDDIWYQPTSGTSTADTPVATYDAPTLATLVDFRVKPVPKYSTSFKAEWTDREMYTVPSSFMPTKSSAPTVTLDGFNLTATLDTYDEKASMMEFEVINIATNTPWATATAEVVYNRASAVFTVAAGGIYRVHVRGYNANNEAGDWSEWSSDVTAVPAPLVNPPEVIATSEDSVQVSWQAAPGAKSYDVEWSEKKRYFDTAPDKVQSQTGHEFTTLEVTPESGHEWFFRVRVVNDAGHSDWTEPVSLFLGKVPLAPTTWSSTSTASINRDIYLYWTHNAEDKSKESSAELELIVNGVLETHTITKEPTSTETTSYYKIAANTYESGAKIQWRVRTKGVMPDYGPFSTQRIVQIYAPPSLNVTLATANDWEWDPFDFTADDIFDAAGEKAPLLDGTMTTFPLIVYLDSYPTTQTPISYTLSIASNTYYEDEDEVGESVIINVGDILFQKYYSTNKRNFYVMLNAGDVNLASEMSYTLTATVTMDSGLSATATQTFNVIFEEGAVTLDAEIIYDDDLYATYIRPECTDDDGNTASGYLLSIYRREFDGDFVRIASGIPSEAPTTATDPHPSLDYARYRIVAMSTSTGQVWFADLYPYEVDESSIIIQWDEEWSDYIGDLDEDTSEPPWNGSVLVLPYNIDVSESNSIDVELVNYIGRKHPVSYYGTHVGQGGTWKTDIPADDKETLYALRRLAVWMGDAYVREPSGIGYWAQVEVSMDQQHLAMVIPVTIKVTRVEGGI